MSIQEKYDRLVKQWGRELANEIMVKRAATLGFEKKGKAARRRSPILAGSFENGKRR